MGDLSKLRIAIGQPEFAAMQPAVNEQVRERMVAKALDAGADVLALPGSFEEPGQVGLIALNDSRIDLMGHTVLLEAAGETYRVSIGVDAPGCDFALWCHDEPWSLKAGPFDPGVRPSIVLRPVGMRNCGKKVLAYDGASHAVSADGATVARLRDDFEEDFALVTFAQGGPVLQPCEDKLLACLLKTIRRFDTQVLGGSARWVIGLSGGLDSSVVAALLVKALGADRVRGYSLTTKFNSRQTQGNAAALADALGIELRQGSINQLVEATEDVCRAYGYGGDELPALSGLVLENVQARVRGHLLCTFAALEGGVVANNGNRVESALGYATLYGDAIGALAPVGDLVKTRLFDVARAVNAREGREVIPENLLPTVTDGGYDWEVMPSAELAEGQKDPMKWFYHDWLVEQLLDAESVDAGACSVLERYLDDRLRSTEAGRWAAFYGLDEPSAFLQDFDWVMRSLRTSAFKRVQAPPAITVASPQSVRRPDEVQGPLEPSERLARLRARLAAL